MPEVQEVFRMSTQKVRQDPGAMERQQTKQVRAARNKKVGAFVVVAAIAAAAIVLILSTRPVESTAPPANGAIVDPVDATAVKVATDFVVAYGSFDADKATLRWPLLQGVPAYVMYRGNLSDLVDADQDGLPDLGYGACVSDTDPNTADDVYVDGQIPGEGQGFFYVKGVRDGATIRGLGVTSSVKQRVPAVSCP